MISVKKLIKLARKWQKVAALQRKRISLPQTVKTADDASSCSTSLMEERGHFVVYFADQKRFLLPLEYLDNRVIRELFKAEEEFGLPSKGALTLPSDAEFKEYVIALIKQKVNEVIENAILTSIASSSCSSMFHLRNQVTSHQLTICSF